MEKVFQFYKNNLEDWDEYLYKEDIKDKENNEYNNLLWGGVVKGDEKSLFLKKSQSDAWLKLYFVEHNDNYSYLSIINTESKCPGARRCSISIYPPGEVHETLSLGGCDEPLSWY